GPGVRFGAPGFTRAGDEPYTPAADSPAAGAADASVYDGTSKDLRGRPRLKDGRADLGALAAAT
ncbi:MAG: hypothetical protein ACK4N5_23240, partial [Myxococcales bacterium]